MTKIMKKSDPLCKDLVEPSEVDSEDKYFNKIKGFENKRSIKKGKTGA